LTNFLEKERKRFKTDYSKGKDESRKQKERADRRKEETFEAKKAVGSFSSSYLPLLNEARRRKKENKVLEMKQRHCRLVVHLRLLFLV